MSITFLRNSTLALAIAVAIVGIISTNAFAHVTVKPAEVVTAGFITFAVSVPNEKDIDVTNVKLLIPKGLNYVQPTVKNGWTISTEKTGSGESATVTSITWSNGTIPAEMRDEFTFSAQVPKSSSELQWKAYQTYSDGSVSAWDQADESKEEEGKGPFSVTKVVAQTESETATNSASESAKSAKSSADTALIIAVVALISGGAGVALAARKNK